MSLSINSDWMNINPALLHFSCFCFFSCQNSSSLNAESLINLLWFMRKLLPNTRLRLINAFTMEVISSGVVDEGGISHVTCQSRFKLNLFFP